MPSRSNQATTSHGQISPRRVIMVWLYGSARFLEIGIDHGLL